MNVKLTPKNKKLVVRGEVPVFSNGVKQIVIELNLALSSTQEKYVRNDIVKESKFLQMCPISELWNIYTITHLYVHMFERDIDDVKSRCGTLAQNLKLRFEQLDRIANLKQRFPILGTNKRRRDDSKKSITNVKRRRDGIPSLEPLNP